MRNILLKKILKQTKNPFYENEELEFWFSISHLDKKLIETQKSIKEKFVEISNIKDEKEKYKKSKNLIYRLFIPQYEANSGCNFILSNLPEKAGEQIVDEGNLYETFKPYGDIYGIKKFDNRLYIWFYNKEDADNAIITVNNMQMGENIIYANTPRITPTSSPKSIPEKYCIETN